MPCCRPGTLVTAAGVVLLVALVGHGRLDAVLGARARARCSADSASGSSSHRSSTSCSRQSTIVRVGPASGILNAFQQLSGAFGVALLGTLFFDALGRAHFHRALSQTLWVEAGLCVLALVLSPLLPPKPRPEGEALLLAD